MDIHFTLVKRSVNGLVSVRNAKVTLYGLVAQRCPTFYVPRSYAPRNVIMSGNWHFLEKYPNVLRYIAMCMLLETVQ